MGFILKNLALFVGWMLVGGGLLWFGTSEGAKASHRFPKCVCLYFLSIAIFILATILITKALGSKPESLVFGGIMGFLIAQTFLAVSAKMILQGTWSDAIVGVVATILPTLLGFALLTIISFLNTPQVRTSIEMAEGEIRSLSSALEEYIADTGTYPRPHDASGALLESPSQTGSGIYYEGPSYLSWQLTTPIECLSVYPLDPFVEEFAKEDLPPFYGYGVRISAGTGKTLILSSIGPDGQSSAEELERMYLIDLEGDVNRVAGDGAFQSLIYSPTNGSWSGGDIVWIDTGRYHSWIRNHD